MTIAQQVGKVVANIEATTSTNEFAQLAKFIMASGGVSKAARAAETTSLDGNLGPRLARILKSGLLNDISRGTLHKAAATAGTLAAFSDYSVIAQGFVNSLVNASAFDTMLASMTPVPLRPGTLGAVSTGAQAFSVAEGSTKAISKLSLTGQQQNPHEGTLHRGRDARVGEGPRSSSDGIDRARTAQRGCGDDRHTIHRDADRRTFCRNICRTDE